MRLTKQECGMELPNKKATAKERKELVQHVLDKKPEAHKTKNQYRVVRAVITQRFKDHVKDIPEDVLLAMLYTACHAQRDWRNLRNKTEDTTIMEQEAKLSYGYSPNHLSDMKKLGTL